jgi:hypothetical protein
MAIKDIFYRQFLLAAALASALSLPIALFLCLELIESQTETLFVFIKLATFEVRRLTPPPLFLPPPPGLLPPPPPGLLPLPGPTIIYLLFIFDTRQVYSIGFSEC